MILLYFPLPERHGFAKLHENGKVFDESGER